MCFVATLLNSLRFARRLSLGLSLNDPGVSNKGSEKFFPSCLIRPYVVVVFLSSCLGDGTWAWIPGGGLRSAPFPPPTSDY